LKLPFGIAGCGCTPTVAMITVYEDDDMKEDQEEAMTMSGEEKDRSEQSRQRIYTVDSTYTPARYNHIRIAFTSSGGNPSTPRNIRYQRAIDLHAVSQTP